MSNLWTIYGPGRSHVFRFVSWGIATDVRIGEVLRQWQGTPYVEGAMVKRAGADCVRALAGVLADVAGFIPVPLCRLPADAAMSAPESARAAMRALIREFCATQIEDTTLKPLDFLVTRPPGNDTGPGHAMMVGPHKSLWHMDRQAGFCRVGNSLEGNTLVACYRVPFDLWEV